MSQAVIGSGFCFSTDTATTEIYTLSLHDALPISMRRAGGEGTRWRARFVPPASRSAYAVDYYVEAKSAAGGSIGRVRSEEHTSELQSRRDLVCRLLLEKKKYDLDQDHGDLQ